MYGINKLDRVILRALKMQR